MPTVGASGGAGRDFGSGNDRSSFNVGADASWEIDLFGRIRRGIEASGADAQSVYYDREALRVAIAAELGTNYIQARLAQERLALARDTLAIADDNLQIARWRVEAGLVSSLDSEQARAARAQTAASIPSIEAAYAGAAYRLAVLTGRPPGALNATLDEARPIPDGPDEVAIGIPADTLRQLPDIRAAERNLAAQTARIGVAEAQLIRARLSGNIGTSALSLGGLFSAITGGIFSGLSQTLFDGGRLRSQLRSQQAATEGALAGYRQSILTALEDVENALVALNAARARQAEFAIALEAANNTAILARTQYRSGLTDFRQLLESERPCSPPATAWSAAAPTKRWRWSSFIALSAAAGMPARLRQWKETMAETTTNEATTTPVTNEAGLEDFLGAPAAKPWYKRPLYIVGAVVAVLALLLLSRCFVGEGEGGYATAEVRRGQLSVTVSATGNLQPTNQVEVGSEQSGLVTQVYVDNNDRVVAGQPLARLDTSRLQDTSSRRGRARRRAGAGRHRRCYRAQARAGLPSEEVFRSRAGGCPSETELDAREPRPARLAGVVRSGEVAQARAQVSSAQTNLSKATLYSPVTGVVLSRQIDPGQTVAASFQAPVLFTIAEDLGAMQLEVRVDEADVAQVQQGQRASFTVDAYPGRTFPATVTRVDVGANASGAAASTTAAAGTGSVVAYTAELAVDNPEQLLRPGMTATAEIVTTERRNVLLVPNAALRWSPERDAAQAGQGGGITSVLVPQRGRGGRGGNRAERQVEIGRGSRQSVYVVGDDGTPVRVQVVVGESNGSVTEVTGGELREGQEVITARLAAGQTQEKSENGGERKGRGNRGGGGDGQGNSANRRRRPRPPRRNRLSRTSSSRPMPRRPPSPRQPPRADGCAT